MKFNAETALAFARLISTLAVSVVAAFGWALDFNLVFNIVASALGVIGMTAGLWWKNNNVTEPAQEAQLLLDEIKANNKAELEEVKAIENARHAK